MTFGSLPNSEQSSVSCGQFGRKLGHNGRHNRVHSNMGVLNP